MFVPNYPTQRQEANELDGDDDMAEIMKHALRTEGVEDSTGRGKNVNSNPRKPRKKPAKNAREYIMQQRQKERDKNQNKGKIL